MVFIAAPGHSIASPLAFVTFIPETVILSFPTHFFAISILLSLIDAVMTYPAPCGVPESSL